MSKAFTVLAGIAGIIAGLATLAGFTALATSGKGDVRSDIFGWSSVGAYALALVLFGIAMILDVVKSDG